ncbi:MAG TPA: rod shape-determining protein MreC [Planctomycetota bacterium]|nr:rod shape-determining protein MreC [Planctomycetota bacterium]
MARNVARSHLLFPGLVLAALLLFLVPEAQVTALRGRAISSLTPVLTISSARRSQALKPALIAVPVKAPEKAPNQPTPESVAEIDLYRAEVARLQAELIKLQQATGHSAALKGPAGISADVIARKTLWQEPILALNKGEADGVRMHAGVLHRGAVLGRVITTGPRASCIALLTHRGLSIAARLAECRVEGVLQGMVLTSKDEGGEKLCRMQVVAKELNAKVGEHVVTSGYDGAFPAGLWLGVVTQIKKKGDVQWEVTVRPACDENAVECVQILTNVFPDVPWPVQPRKK